MNAIAEVGFVDKGSIDKYLTEAKLVLPPSRIEIPYIDRQYRDEGDGRRLCDFATLTSATSWETRVFSPAYGIMAHSIFRGSETEKSKLVPMVFHFYNETITGGPSSYRIILAPVYEVVSEGVSSLRSNVLLVHWFERMKNMTVLSSNDTEGVIKTVQEKITDKKGELPIQPNNRYIPCVLKAPQGFFPLEKLEGVGIQEVLIDSIDSTRNFIDAVGDTVYAAPIEVFRMLGWPDGGWDNDFKLLRESWEEVAINPSIPVSTRDFLMKCIKLLEWPPPINLRF